MKTQHVFSASAAAVLAMTMAAFAQSAPQPAPPASPSAQTSRQPETKVTLVGCLMRETDYRKANDSGKGGPLGTGVGTGNEFVLVNAAKVTSGATPPAATGECGVSAAGAAYELSGSREKELAKSVGRRVEISGTLKEAETTAGPGGEPKPTGGVDPLKQDLKLFEVDVASFRELPASQTSAAPPAAQAAAPTQQAAPAQPAPAPRPAPEAAPAQPEPSPAPAPAPRQNLPRTASSLPVAGLFGFLSLVSGIALRRRS
jgi:hypothetical protein